MSNDNFLKGACQHCAGHFEFPAASAGETVPCPHCGQPTQLTAPAAPKPVGGLKFKLKINYLGILVILVVAGAAALVFNHRQNPPLPPPAPQTNMVDTPPPPPKPKTDEATTNDFAITGIKLEKQKGSSLVYVTGQLRNLAPRQRFEVNVEFTLFDTNDQPIGKAKDYHGLLEPQGKWSFKAMVLETKTTYARFLSVSESQ